MYIGLGYDIHRFIKGRPLILGGVQIPFNYGLDGHSDADVLAHALMDALLGAAGKPDIGNYFPNTDNKYKNISSMELLKKVLEVLEKEHLKINNIDMTVLAEQPAISPFVEKIKINISKVLKIPKERIGLKASTNEKLGFIGRKEGIASMAVALLIKGNF